MRINGKKLKYTIYRKDLYPILLSVLVLLSCYHVAVLSTLWILTLLASIGMLIFEILYCKYAPSKIALALGVFFLISFISTGVNQEITIDVLRMYLIPVVYVFWCDLYCKKHTEIFLGSHVVIVGIICLIQLYFQIVDPAFFGQGESGNMYNLLASDNYLGYYLVPFLVLIFVRSRWLKRKINAVSWLLLVACVYSVSLSGAGACTLGIWFFAIMMIVVCWFGRDWLRVNLYIIYAVYILFLVLILVFSVQTFLSDFLMNAIGKDATFTGRIYIWARIPAYIKAHPWLGYGISSSGTTSIISALGSSVHAHNYFFEILITGGILQMIPYIIVLILIVKPVQNCGDNVIANIIKFGLLSMFIMYTTEGVILQPAQYLVYFLAFYSPMFANENYAVESIVTQKQRKRLRFRLRKRNTIQ